MANVKELRGRIRSVTNISQITKAMEMVASMKLRKVQAKALASRPYTEEIRAFGRRFAAAVGNDAVLPLLRGREVESTGIFLVTSDRGLCGAYNANVIARTHRWIDRLRAEHPGRRYKLFIYGRKGYVYFYRRDFEVARYFVDPPLDRMDFHAARLVVAELVRAFEEREVDEVRLMYTSFLSPARFAPAEVPFIPLPQTKLEEGDSGKGELDYLLEPSPEALLNAVIPRYLETMIYGAMLESLASEHASRRMAMKGATDAASRMKIELRRAYNRARQESITKELLDIIGGAAAVS